MKFLIKKIYIILPLLIVFWITSSAFAKGSTVQYSKENVSNYFLGAVSVNQDYNSNAYKYLSKIKLKKNIHTEYNIKFIRTLILLGKFDQAFAFAKKVWSKDELFFEADLLLGLDSFLKKDYMNAEKYFERLNRISRYNLFFDNFVGNVLIAWSRAAQSNKEESFKFLKKIPYPYDQIKNTQDVFLKCYFDLNTTQQSLEELVKNENYNFSRYNFFLANYLLSKKKATKALKIIQDSRKEHNSNLLLKQTEQFFHTNNKEKITDFFDCKNPKNSLAEFFYIISNLYSSEEEYRLSNFYLKISLFLNERFLPNKTLLAENFFLQKKYKESKNIYKNINSIGGVYSWHSSKSIASILLIEKGKDNSIDYLKKNFNLIPNPNYEHYYELANFYKDNEYYRESIKYYTLALKKLKNDHFLIPKILDRRGTSFERIGEWKNAEKDLTESLKIFPDQAHVLNYLAYTWIDKGINLDKGLEMLKKATRLRENDGYIIDSLGWAYFAKKDYIQAELHLRRAVELLPLDPIINDHYADALWMLNKDIQARYFWNNILKLTDAEKKLKDNIKKKLIFGVTK